MLFVRCHDISDPVIGKPVETGRTGLCIRTKVLDIAPLSDGQLWQLDRLCNLVQ